MLSHLPLPGKLTCISNCPYGMQCSSPPNNPGFSRNIILQDNLPDYRLLGGGVICWEPEILLDS